MRNHVHVCQVLGGRKLDFHSATCSSSSATTLEVGEEGGEGTQCRGWGAGVGV